MPMLTPDSRRGPHATTFIDVLGKTSRFRATNVCKPKKPCRRRMNTGGA
jgi:hypothetical protein